MARLKILIVDDSRVAATTATRMLAECPGYEVVTASDGEEGVSMALRERPDLILMDDVMPRMDGFEATRKLRGHQDTRGIPIILVTTRWETANVEAGLESGCDDTIRKPIDAALLLQKVQNLIGA